MQKSKKTPTFVKEIYLKEIKNIHKGKAIYKFFLPNNLHS